MQPNLERLIRVLRAAEADIIGLNEVFYPRVVAGSAKPALEALADALGMHHLFGPCLRWPAHEQMPADAYGNALLSRWPIIAGASHHLTPKEAGLQAAVAGKEQRGLLEARIARPDRDPITIYVTHLDHTDEDARLAQLRTAHTWTSRDRNRPHLIMGDFNAISPWDWDEKGLDFLLHQPENRGGNLVSGGPRVVAQMEKNGYIDAYRRYGEPGRASFLAADEKQLRIDYIFASQQLAATLTDCRILIEEEGTEASDHRPVRASFDW